MTCSKRQNRSLQTPKHGTLSSIQKLSASRTAVLV